MAKEILVHCLVINSSIFIISSLLNANELLQDAVRQQVISIKSAMSVRFTPLTASKCCLHFQSQRKKIHLSDNHFLLNLHKLHFNQITCFYMRFVQRQSNCFSERVINWVQTTQHADAIQISLIIYLWQIFFT